MAAGTQKLSVLMGDIIGSETMDRARLHEVFNEEIANANETHPDELASPLTITLGDEFQGLVRTTADAFRLANGLRLSLLVRSVPCRFVIGQANIETPVNERSAWNMLGTGLAEARGRLNDKKEASAYRFSLLTPDNEARIEALQKLLDALGSALSDTEAGWTRIQLETIALWNLYQGDAGKVAAKRAVSKRAVYNALETADWQKYTGRRDALHAFLKTSVSP